MSEWKAMAYNSAGEEILLKPGHALVSGRESCVQVAIDTYEVKMVYKLGSGHLESKLKSVVEGNA